ncbi:SET domain-containing protein-lysine N-methyltransferase [Nostoc calcicola FACHB-389]|nr:SET domain-containing protein-lysine N-methyltransferase [Nostoc calcicola FACHB-3891]OKH17454.1 SET domain-containing protein-lysine N-methyltransferase [Nostoc calcicola FACHB-389]
MYVVGYTKQKGRGVFAKKRFLKGEVIERASVVVIPAEEVTLIDRTILANYYYDWEDRTAAMALSWVSLMNHSYQPNTFYVKKFSERVIEYIVYRDIEVGEEITANYNGSPENQSPIWFDVVDDISSIILPTE